MGELRNVGDAVHGFAQILKQGEAIAAEFLVVHHHHD